MRCVLKAISLALLIGIAQCAVSGMSKTKRDSLVAELCDQCTVMVGALFPMHKKFDAELATAASADGEACGPIWEQYGIQRLEVALDVVDKVNKAVLKGTGLKLGIQIRDSCWTERVAMEQTIEFIRASLGEHDAGTCPTTQPSQTNLAASIGVDGGARAAKPVVAVIGPGSSGVSIATQNLLQVFHVPQISYSATSNDLSNRHEFKYFMRMVPSDAWQAKAMVDIIKRFHWTYVAVVYSDGNYGEKGFEQLKQLIDAEPDICIATYHKISTLSPESEYREILVDISRHKTGTVIICFCEGDVNKQFFHVIKGANRPEWNFQWVGSESWNDRDDVVKGYEEQAKGSLVLRIDAPPLPWFRDLYASLRPTEDRLDRNPWFAQFWMEKFQCVLPKFEQHTTPYVKSDAECDVAKQNLTNEFKADTKLSQVTNALFTIAHALKNLNNEVCAKNPEQRLFTGGTCTEMQQVDGAQLLKHMMKTSFTSIFAGVDNQTDVYFDENGDPPARYDVLNYQGKELGDSDKQIYVKVGHFRNEKLAKHGGDGVEWRPVLNLDTARVIWPNGSSLPPVSICNEECDSLEAKIIASNSKCCWTCVRCNESSYLQTPFQCVNCPLYTWPNINKNECLPIVEEYLKWNDLPAIFAMSLSILGIVATMFTIAVFLRMNNTPIVKATTRELSYIILCGIILCYAVTFVIVLKPTNLTCHIVTIMPGLSFSMIYGALLTKTNRIARIMAMQKKIRASKPRFLSITAQLVLTCVTVCVEVVILLALVVVDAPHWGREPDLLPKRVVLICQSSGRAFIIPFAWDIVLIALCTVYAVKTRNVPSNFNEAKFIGFTMYTTCIIWIAFIVIYFGSPAKAITMCFSFSFSATVALVLLFVPKVYLMLLHPEKNVHKPTDPNIRTHIKSQASMGQTRTKTTQQSRRAASSVGRAPTGNGSVGSADSTDVRRPHSHAGGAALSTAGKPGELFRHDSIHVPKAKGPSVVAGASNPAQTRGAALSIIEESQNTTGTDAAVRTISMQGSIRPRASISTRTAAVQTDLSLVMQAHWYDEAMTGAMSTSGSVRSRRSKKAAPGERHFPSHSVSPTHAKRTAQTWCTTPPTCPCPARPATCTCPRCPPPAPERPAPSQPGFRTAASLLQPDVAPSKQRRRSLFETLEHCMDALAAPAFAEPTAGSGGATAKRNNSVNAGSEIRKKRTSSGDKSTSTIVTVDQSETGTSCELPSCSKPTAADNESKDRRDSMLKRIGAGVRHTFSRLSTSDSKDNCNNGTDANAAAADNTSNDTNLAEQSRSLLEDTCDDLPSTDDLVQLRSNVTRTPHRSGSGPTHLRHSAANPPPVRPLSPSPRRQQSDAADSGIVIRRGSADRSADDIAFANSKQSSLSSRHGGSGRAFYRVWDCPRSAAGGPPHGGVSVVGVLHGPKVSTQPRPGTSAKHKSRQDIASPESAEFRNLLNRQGLQATQMSHSTLV